jgi:hypothetical protein
LTGAETAKLCVEGKMSYLNRSGVSGSISHETEQRWENSAGPVSVLSNVREHIKSTNKHNLSELTWR